MNVFYFDGMKRFDLGFGNPNITGALLTQIAILALTPFFQSGCNRKCLTASLSISIVSTVLVVITGSRGACVGLIAGLLFLGAIAKFYHLKFRLLLVLLVPVSTMIVTGIVTGFGARYQNALNGSDASVTNRWDLYWTATPMLWTAKSGWGDDRSSEAFHHFFQKLDRSENFGSLINTHLTFFAECGIIPSVAYLVVWAIFFSICIPSKLSLKEWHLVIAASVFSMFIMCAFTTFSDHIEVFSPSVLALGIVIVSCIWSKCLPSLGGILYSSGILVICYAALIVTSFSMAKELDPACEIRDGWVFLEGRDVRENQMAIWTFLGTSHYTSRTFGHSLRRFTSDLPNRRVRVSWSQPSSFPVYPNDLVLLFGDGIEDFEAFLADNSLPAMNVLLVNPPRSEAVAAWAEASGSRLEILWGQFNRNRSRSFWTQLAKSQERITFKILPEVAIQVPNLTWLTEVVRRTEPKSEIID